ncbi:MAG: hypothetical protein QM813_02760 [Verrucomicrobiota bacterium]
MKGQILAIYLAVGAVAISSATTIDQNWESRFVLAPGLNDSAYAMVGIETTCMWAVRSLRPEAPTLQALRAGTARSGIPWAAGLKASF